MWQIVLLLLPIAALSGWYFGYGQKREAKITKQNNPPNEIHEDYFLGLNYLINEEPDKAVDVFIRMLEVNSDTVETHLALGNLFRKRGEVDRAIRVHQNIIARPKLVKSQRILALSELAQDYLYAGFLDRAERILLELIEISEETLTSYRYLLNIYEQQKKWDLAIDISKKLQSISDIKMWTPIAYYYCELAEYALEDGNSTEEVYKYLKKALNSDKNCVRANIILGKLETDNQEYKAAIRAYKKVKEQDPAYFPEVINQLESCYRKLHLEKEYKQFIRDSLADVSQAALILKLANYIKQSEGNDEAIEFIISQLNRKFSMHSLASLLELYSTKTENISVNKLSQIKKIIDKFLETKPLYRCVNCGFSGRQLYWQCPSCKKWGTVKPGSDL